MIRLIVTSNAELYRRLADRARAEGDTPRQAPNVLDGLRCAKSLPMVGTIVIDMALHAADTLVETLHSTEETSQIPVYAVQTHCRLPLELRRLCTDVLEMSRL